MVARHPSLRIVEHRTPPAKQTAQKSQFYWHKEPIPFPARQPQPRIIEAPLGLAELNRVLLPEQQSAWQADLNCTDLAGPRPVALELRAETAWKYERLCELPLAEPLIDVLRTFVRAGIPAPLRSEMLFWTCTALPSESPLETVYARISIFRQEVLTVGMVENTPYFAWNVARSPFAEAFGEALLRWKLCVRYRTWASNDRSHAGGTDQLHIESVGSVAHAHRLLGDAEFLHAVRRFNLRLMQQGGTPNPRAHCPALADRLLA